MKNKIFPCLWFDGNGKEAADFYAEIFGGTITSNNPIVINLELFGQKLMILNGGPQFEKNASISFLILCESEKEVEKYWKNLSEKGLVLMELGAYPWSKKYGWVRDQFGVTWQISLSEKQVDQKIIPNLMFIHENNGKAHKAMDFYTKIFPDSKLLNILKYNDGLGEKSGENFENIQQAHFQIAQFSFFCMDNSYDHQFDFNEAISMVVMTENQEETDYLWNSLIAEGGKEGN